MKRTITILALLAFLPLAAGATPFLHHHNHQEAADFCQLCYLVKVGSVALAIAFVMLLVATQAVRPLPLLVDSVARNALQHPPAAPRAPPLH